MYFSDQSFEQAERNLAWDEACIEYSDRQVFTQESAGIESHSASFPANFELLRIWKFAKPTVVMGRASRVEDEVYIDRCEQDGVGVFRRSSGGSTIIAGTGCLMYSVLLSYHRRPAWRSLDTAHLEVMSRVSTAVSGTLVDYNVPDEIQLEGTCDLTWNHSKFSGNALRCKRQFMLYHGTILIDMPLDWVSTYLKEPPRQPDYRSKRHHGAFVRNLLEPNSPTRDAFEANLTERLKKVWQARSPLNTTPWQQALDLEAERWVSDRYSNRDWNFER